MAVNQKRGFVIYEDIYEIANVYVIRSVSAVVCPVCQARTLYRMHLQRDEVELEMNSAPRV